jgi:hypothetical protein
VADVARRRWDCATPEESRHEIIKAAVASHTQSEHMKKEVSDHQASQLKA